jgi:transcriptional regulator GlxA family with amidase domain
MMTTIAITASPMTFVASLGAMLDGYSRLGEAYLANPAMGDYARLNTQLRLASISSNSVSLAGGRHLEPDVTLMSLERPQLIYLPSFQIADPDDLGALMRTHDRFHAWLRYRHAEGILIGACGASVCHLAASGLLDGKTAAVVPRLAGSFRHHFPKVRTDSGRPIVVTEQMMTCGPDFANPGLVQRMFARIFGMDVAQMLEMRDPQIAPPPLFDATPDRLVAEAKIWITERFARDFTIAELAQDLGVTHQTLIRRFRGAGIGTPRAFAQEARATAAASMLVETNRTIAEVAALVGYSDTASFRRIFAAKFGMSPSAYRHSRQNGTTSQPQPLSQR